MIQDVNELDIFSDEKEGNLLDLDPIQKKLDTLVDPKMSVQKALNGLVDDKQT